MIPALLPAKIRLILLCSGVCLSDVVNKSAFVQKEIVTITLLGGSRFEVIVNYRIANAHNDGGEYVFPETEQFALENFSVYWEGKRLATQKLIADKSRRLRIGDSYYPAVYKYLVKPASQHEAERVIRYEFAAPLCEESKFTAVQGNYIEYVLRTAATWKQPIAELEVHIEGPRCHDLVPVYMNFQGYCLSEYHWVFRAQNIIPRDNIQMIWRRAES